MSRTPEGILADVAAATGVTVAGATWIAQLNAVLQLGLTAISIVGVIYAIRWHRIRIKAAKEKLNGKQSDRGPAGRTSQPSGGSSPRRTERGEEK